MRRRKRPELPGEEIWGPAQVGALLRQRRESRGLSVAEVAHRLRCVERRILCVEAGRFDELPPQPYGRGLIAAYAALVELDAPALLRACGESFGLEGGRPKRGVLLRPLSRGFNWRDWTVPLALSGALACFLVARSVLTPVPPPLEEPPAVPAAQDAPPAAPPATDAAANPEPPPAALPAPGVLVLLRSEGSTWVDAGADGAEPQRHDLGPGQNLELAARERLSLALGDAGVVRLKVNDRELGFIGFKGEEKRGILFTAAKRTAGRPGAGRADEGGNGGRAAAGD